MEEDVSCAEEVSVSSAAAAMDEEGAEIGRVVEAVVMKVVEAVEMKVVEAVN